MTIRKCFYETYKDIPKRWGISKEEVLDLINKYDRQLIDEILDPTPLTISRFFKDRRNPHEYYFDILEGRLAEDLVILYLRSKGHVVNKIGSDKDGKILRSGSVKISTTPDIEVDGEPLEIQISREGGRNRYHVKLGKGNKIIAGKNKLMFVVGDEYFIVDKELIAKSEKVVNSAWGGKEVYEIANPKYISFK